MSPDATSSPPQIPPPSLPDNALTRLLHDPGAVTDQAWGQITTIAAQLAPWAALGAAVVVGVWVLRSVLRRHAQRRWVAGARLVTILAPPEVDPTGAEALWGNLVALLRPAWRRWLEGQPHLTFELTASVDGLTVALWVPATVPPEMIERAVGAAWPGARTTTTTRPDTPPLRTGSGAAVGGRLRLARPDWFPIRSAHDSDPSRTLLGALADAAAGEVCCVQVLARPVTGRRLTRAHKAAVARRSGRPTSRAGAVADLLIPGRTRRPTDVDPQRSRDVAAILDKAAHAAWETEVRYAASTSVSCRHGRAIARGRAHAIASAFAVYAGANHFVHHRLPRPATILRSRRFGAGNVLSVPELAALAHLPTDAAVVGLARAGARAAPAPPAVAAGGKVIGDADSGARRPVGLSVTDARHHLHVLGATGVGKSTLLTNLILNDIAAGRGVVVIDPKGDLVTDVLDRLPAGCTPVLIDPEDDQPPALNVLEGPDAHLTVDNLVGIFRSIFERFWGPRTDDVLRAACLTLCHHARTSGHPAVLTDVPRLLSDEAFQATATAGINDPAGLGSFWAAYRTMGDANRAQTIAPLLNKLRAFLLRDFVRDIVGSTSSSFSMGDVLDGRAPLLVRVPKGILGEDTARLLGSFVVAQVWQSAAHRARLGQPARVDAALYIDECQNFLTLPRSFDEMLAEARGYRLSLVLAHQHLGQLSRDLRDALAANARSKVWFDLGADDARVLERHVSPELSAHDLAHLPAYTVAARLVTEGVEAPACTVVTRPAPPPIPGRARTARAAAQRRYGRSVSDRRRSHHYGRKTTAVAGPAR